MLGALPFCFVEPLSLKCLKIKCQHWTQDFDPTIKTNRTSTYYFGFHTELQGYCKIITKFILFDAGTIVGRDF